MVEAVALIKSKCHSFSSFRVNNMTTICRVIFRNGDFESITGRSVADVERKLSTRQSAHVIGWNSGNGGDTKYQRMSTAIDRRKLLASLNHSLCGIDGAWWANMR